jgi:quercetin dioxygenase-like cupin family protein
MKVHDWNRMDEERMSAGISRKVIHTANMTVARISLAKGAVVPNHSHVNEQISTIVSGALRFVLDGTEVVARAGEMVEIPPHVPHSVVALEDSVAVDTFAPVREDWRRGDDAYLRR